MNEIGSGVHSSRVSGIRTATVPSGLISVLGPVTRHSTWSGAAQVGICEVVVMIARRKFNLWPILEFIVRQQSWAVPHQQQHRALYCRTKLAGA
jgi:hypothetical protein